MTFQAELEPKYLQILKELLPNLSRVTLIRAGADNNPNAPQITGAAAASLGIALVEIDLHSPDELRQAFGRLEREKPQALIAAPSGLLYAYRQQFVEFTTRNRIPAIYGLREVVADGGLLSLSPNLSDIAVRGAYYVDRIFKGTKPADLPVEQPKTFELIINLKSAKLIGLTIPASLLARADQVIE
jgi:putative ABC transport system substrate-binding protein